MAMRAPARKVAWATKLGAGVAREVTAAQGAEGLAICRAIGATGAKVAVVAKTAATKEAISSPYLKKCGCSAAAPGPGHALDACGLVGVEMRSEVPVAVF
jgi:hypothetical protein